MQSKACPVSLLSVSAVVDGTEISAGSGAVCCMVLHRDFRMLPSVTTSSKPKTFVCLACLKLNLKGFSILH